MMAGGLFNALAFAGAGFLFKSLDGNKYGDEMKRHNLAVERLAREKEKWNEEEVEHRDKLARLRLALSDANHNINDTNAALDLLSATFRREPRLRDYYAPSSEMRGYLSITEGAMYLSAGWVGYKTYGYITRN